MVRYLYSELASLIDARKRCAETNNQKWHDKHEDTIEYLVKQFLPSGSGFDCGTKIDLDSSHANKLVFTTSYHHMHESGMYDGWTEHTITVTPSLAYGFNIRIGGRNRNDIKELILQDFESALNSDCEFEVYQMVFDIGWQYKQDPETGYPSYSGYVQRAADNVRYFVETNRDLNEVKGAVLQYLKANTADVRRLDAEVTK